MYMSYAAILTIFLTTQSKIPMHTIGLFSTFVSRQGSN